MGGLCKATLLGLSLCSLIVLLSTAWAEKNKGASVIVIDFSKKDDQLKFTKETKDKIPIQLHNLVGSDVIIECKSARQGMGKRTVSNKQTLVFYFDPNEKQNDKFSCDVTIPKHKLVNFNVYDPHSKGHIGQSTNSFDLKADGVYMSYIAVEKITNL